MSIKVFSEDKLIKLKLKLLRENQKISLASWCPYKCLPKETLLPMQTPAVYQIIVCFCSVYLPVQENKHGYPSWLKNVSFFLCERDPYSDLDLHQSP
jgi:hypothetical protein